MAADRGECSILVLLDLSAAFDTVNHRILLQRLHDQFGIKGHAHKWKMSYLQNRCRQVMIENSLLTEVVLTLNVPQGSILGPSEYSDFTEPVGQVIRSDQNLLHHTFMQMTLNCMFIVINQMRFRMQYSKLTNAAKK